MGKRGRHKITWNDEQYRQLEELCKILATQREIEAVMGHDIETISRLCRDHYGKDFSEVQQQYAAFGKVSLRRMQFQLAEKNVTMAIFLGKVLLGQRDAEEEQIDDGALSGFLERMRRGQSVELGA